MFGHTGIVLIVAFRKMNIGTMKVHEERAVTEGQLYNSNKTIPGELKDHLPTSNTGTVGDLFGRFWPCCRNSRSDVVDGLPSNRRKCNDYKNI